MMAPAAVIVGTGIAGVSAAAGLRSAGWEGDIVLLGAETELPYRRPTVSKEIIRGEKTPEQIRIKKAQWYADNGIELRTGVTVDSLDVDRRQVLLTDGETLPYQRLLLATGGTARQLGDASGARTLRTLGDVPQLRRELAPGRQVLVVGAGLIGSEIAASMRELGCAVTLLESAPLPLPRLLPPVLGQMYVDLHKHHGVQLHTDVLIESVVDAGGQCVVNAVDGRSWEAPTVVVAIGMIPETSLAEAAGIELAAPAEGGGILVDAQGQTSVPGVYAAGDVANMPNGVLGGRHRVEHWQGAQNHGTAVGKAMAGAGTDFVEVPWCWSDQYGLNLQVTGWPQACHEVQLRGSIDDHDFTAFFTDGGIVRGAVSIGRATEIRTARKWIAAGARVRPGVLADESTPLVEAVPV